MRAPFLLLAAFTLAACEDEEPTPTDAGRDAGQDTGSRDTGFADAEVDDDAGEDDAGATDSGPRPTVIRLEGTASATSTTGEGADCSFWVDVDQLVFDGNGGWTGNSVGEVIRTVTGTTTDAHYEFTAIVAGPVSLTRTGTNAEARLVGDQPTDAKPFWLELEVLTGTTSDDYRASGAWICAPLDLHEPGFIDFVIRADGTWHAMPTLF